MPPAGAGPAGRVPPPQQPLTRAGYALCALGAPVCLALLAAGVAGLLVMMGESCTRRLSALGPPKPLPVAHVPVPPLGAAARAPQARAAGPAALSTPPALRARRRRRPAHLSDRVCGALAAANQAQPVLPAVHRQLWRHRCAPAPPQNRGLGGAGRCGTAPRGRARRPDGRRGPPARAAARRVVDCQTGAPALPPCRPHLLRVAARVSPPAAAAAAAGRQTRQRRVKRLPTLAGVC
jgi:hypothetical protein